MGVMAVTAGIAVAGGVMQGIGKYKEGQEQASILRDQARLQDRRAHEIFRRAELDVESLMRAKGQASGQAVSASAGQGVGGDVLLQVLIGNERSALREKEIIMEGANFEAEMTQREGQMMQNQARSAERAGASGLFSSIFSGFGNAGMSLLGGGASPANTVSNSGLTTSGATSVIRSGGNRSRLSAGF